MRIYKNNALPPQHLSKLHSWRKVSKKCTKRQGPRSYYIKRNLSWNKHVGITANKTNKVLGIIKRTVGTANQDIFFDIVQVTGKTYSGVRGASVEPIPRKNIHAIEKVQRRASRLALNQGRGEMSYEDKYKLLDWPTLSIRRDYLSLIECYKIVSESAKI